MIKAKIFKAIGTIVVFYSVAFAVFSACTKNDIFVKESDLGGTTTGGTGTSTTGGTGTTTTGGCNPVLNTVSFSGTNGYLWYGFNPMSSTPGTHYGYYCINAVATSNSTKIIKVVLPVTSTPTSNAVDTLSSSFFSTHSLAPGHCAIYLEEWGGSSYYYGYGLSGYVYVTVSGGKVYVSFCGNTFLCKDNNGINWGNFTATGKLDN